MKAITAKLVSRIENLVKEAHSRALIEVKTGKEVVPTYVTVKTRDLEALLEAIRELESEVKKKHHGKPGYAERGIVRYYAPE